MPQGCQTSKEARESFVDLGPWLGRVQDLQHLWGLIHTS